MFAENFDTGNDNTQHLNEAEQAIRDQQAETNKATVSSGFKPGGVFFFTNIAKGNPYRPLIEYFGDWFLIERTE